MHPKIKVGAHIPNMKGEVQRVICTDAPGAEPVVAVPVNAPPSGCSVVARTYTADGKFTAHSLSSPSTCYDLDLGPTKLYGYYAPDLHLGAYVFYESQEQAIKESVRGDKIITATLDEGSEA